MKFKIISLGLLAATFLISCNERRSYTVDQKKLSDTIIKTNFPDSSITKKELGSSEKVGHEVSRIYYDTVINLKFKNLSNVYNYRITDKVFCYSDHRGYDSCFRIIRIYNKKDSLIQTIYPGLRMVPWYLEIPEIRTSRSYITGKNAEYGIYDNHFGELVVADLNFDGLEDFATPVDQGADNGAHYKFYLQNRNGKFEYNHYLTFNVQWFPEKIDNKNMTLTTSVTHMYETWYQAFEFDTITKNWKKLEGYVIENSTGKILK